MSRFALSNRFFKISHRDFFSLATAFKTAAEKSFGTPCHVKVTGLSTPKVYTTFADDDLQSSVDLFNQSRTIFVASEIHQVSKSLFDQSAYLCLHVNPVDPAQASNPSAFGYAEFKGNAPYQAAFYIQCEVKQGAAEEAMREAFPRMAYKVNVPVDNGHRSELQPHSIRGGFAW